MASTILLLSCSDQKGIVARISAFVYANGGNIEHADQHIDSQSRTLFMRIQWQEEGFRLPFAKVAAAFAPLAREFKMTWNLYSTRDVPRVALFVSHHTHCLYDLLLRQKEGELNCRIPLVISNHREAAGVADHFGVKFVYIPKTAAGKVCAERREAALLRKEAIEVVVLARYMQLFSASFVASFAGRMINIHHSFLPAFAGKEPYAQAYRRGVKIIGATSHYVTAKLDSGPIIEQDTVRVSHRDSLDDLRRKGKDLEKIVLSRALRRHLERKILVYDNKTVILY